MSIRTVRRLVAAVCLAGVAAMIAASVADSDGAALAAGIVTAVAMLCLIVATSVTAPALPAPDGEVDLAAQTVERHVADLVAGGADAVLLRTLVTDARRLGRLTTDGDRARRHTTDPGQGP